MEKRGKNPKQGFLVKRKVCVEGGRTPFCTIVYLVGCNSTVSEV